MEKQEDRPRLNTSGEAGEITPAVAAAALTDDEPTSGRERNTLCDRCEQKQKNCTCGESAAGKQLENSFREEAKIHTLKALWGDELNIMDVMVRMDQLNTELTEIQALHEYRSAVATLKPMKDTLAFIHTRPDSPLSASVAMQLTKQIEQAKGIIAAYDETKHKKGGFSGHAEGIRRAVLASYLSRLKQMNPADQVRDLGRVMSSLHVAPNYDMEAPQTEEKS